MWEIPVLVLFYFLLTYFSSKTRAQYVSNMIRQRPQHDDDIHSNQPEKVSPETAKERGKVPPMEYKVLREHRAEMVNTLAPEKIIPYLKHNKVIDKDDVMKIEKKCKDLRRKGAETMLDILYNSGSCAFTKLTEGLKKAGYQEMAHNLTEDLKKKKNDPQSSSTRKQRGCLSGLEFEVLRDNRERMVNELDSSILKNHLFENNLLDEDDMEQISKKEEERRREGAEEMLNIIYNSGSNAFPGLLKSLDQAGYVDLCSKLQSDLKQRKKKAKLDFPDYSHSPRLKPGTMVSNWNQTFAKWKEDDAGKSWCVTMNNWFKDHEFENVEELTLVIKYWLLKMEEVVVKGCLEVDKINVILDVTEAFLKLDRSNSSFPTDKSIFQDLIQYLDPDFSTTEDIKEYKRTSREERKRLFDQYQQVFEKLEDDLDGIIEGKQKSDSSPIDTESCELAGYFHSVVDDVRKIWNKLPGKRKLSQTSLKHTPKQRHK